MAYIKLEDVQKIFTSEIERLHGSGTLENILEKIISLPSIDFEEMIEKEIYGLYTVVTDDGPQDEYYSEGQIALRNLLNKLPK